MPALESLGGASAVFATISIALQLADAAVKLHAFWRSFKDCPKEVNDLLSDLLLLQRVLKDIDEEEKMLPLPHEALPTHEPLLKCEQYFAELEALAQKLQVDISKGKVQRTWKSIKVVFQKEDLGKFKGNLESMKVTLVLARQSLASMLSMHQTRVFASSVNSFSAQQLETARTMRAIESQLQQDTGVIINTLQATSKNALPKMLLSTLESTIKSYVKEGVKESLQELQTRLEDQHNTKRAEHIQRSRNFESEGDDHEIVSSPVIPASPGPVSPIEDQVPDLEHMEETHTSCVQYEQVSNRKVYDTLFGRVEVNIKAALNITRVSDFGIVKDFPQRMFSASLSFKPSSWLSRPAIWSIAVQQKNHSSGQTFNIQPRYSPIVSYKAPIFEACREGDVRKVTGILRTGQASVHDIDEWGRGLMHAAVKSQNTELIKRLVWEGYTKGSVDDYGSSPLDMISFFRKDIVDSSNVMLVAETQLIDLVRVLIEEVDCDPNFEYFENRCSNNLLQNLCKYRRVLDLRELTAMIHYLLTQGSFSMEPSPTMVSQIRDFSPMSDMLYHNESEATANMVDLVQKQKISATFVADFGYSVLQDAVMQDHSIAVLRSLISSGAWLHTKDAERQTPTRIAWWRSQIGEYDLPFASYKALKPPEADYEIFEFLSEDGNFSRALQECGINLWDFALDEAMVLASEDPDEPLQYLTGACYHRKSVDESEGSIDTLNAASTAFRRRSHVSEDP